MVLVALPFRYRVLDQLALRQCGAPLEAGILWELAAEIEPRFDWREHGYCTHLWPAGWYWMSCVSSPAQTTQPPEPNMTEPGNKEQYGEDSQTSAEGAEDERINDPLTRTDVEAPRVPFGSQPSPEE